MLSSQKETANNIYIILIIIIGIVGVILQSYFGQSGMEYYSTDAVGSDDAYISFRFAENLFNRRGLVYNPGEYVEGYSNLLYTLLLAPGFFFGKDFIYPISIGINCIIFTLCIFVFWRFCQEKLGGHLANLGAILLAINPWMWVNASTGLETILILGATLGVWISIENFTIKDSRKNTILLLTFSLISILSRVDGFMLPTIAALYLIIRKQYKKALQFTLFIIFCIMLYTVFRIYYYDDIIANTFYNKVSGSLISRLERGLAFYTDNALKTGLSFALISVYFFIVKKEFIKFTFNDFNFATIFLFLWVLYLIYIGGDIYYERFIVPVIPLSIYTVLYMSKYFAKSHLYIFTCILFLMPFYFISSDARFQYASHNKYDMWINLGKYIKLVHPKATIAIDAAGKVPFFSGLYTIDMLGLNDKHIGKMKTDNQGPPGHTKYDPDYVISKKPTLIAAWIDPNLDVNWGLTKNKYLADYKIKYLINSTRQDLGEKNIINVDGLGMNEIKNLILKKYNYGVLIQRSDYSDIDQITDEIPKIRPNVSYIHTTKDVLFSNWSNAESSHRWSLGTTSSIIFLADNSNKAFNGNLNLNFETFGKQNVTIKLNGYEVFSNVIDASDANIILPFPSVKLNNGINILEFNLPTARQPGKHDSRTIALSLKKFRFE